jgi:hypothetical protein
MTNQVARQAVLITQAALKPGQTPIYIALFNADGSPVTDLTVAPEDTGATVLLTGYVLGAASAVGATDTVNEAMSKLQAQLNAMDTRMDAAETSITDHESRLDALEA